MALGSTKPLTEMSTKNLLGVIGLRAPKADNLTAICWVDCTENMRVSTSHNPMGLRILLQRSHLLIGPFRIKNVQLLAIVIYQR
jgi:hypothetical protein